ncbi:MAG: PTS glucose transporter subunit IIA, partial [Coprobacillus sp.]
PDEVFSQKMMGDGFVVFPSEGTLYSPVDGEVTMIFPTAHAIGIKDNNGIEILIHVGIDTVNLEGKPFELMVKVGQTIKQGDVLMNIDLKMIEENNCSIATPVIITSGQNVRLLKDGNISIKESVLEIL